MKTKEIVNISKIKLGNVPCLYVKPNFMEGKLPTIIFYHVFISN